MLESSPEMKTDAKPAVATPPPLSIVGIGASAGGLEAFEGFFRACPVDTGMAFVLVPHLDPGHESLLVEILQRATAMPVVEARDQIPVVADHVYVIPPNRELALLRGVLQLSVPQQARGQRMPIDGFLRSLAEDQGEHAVGIVLSGTATDGTLGLRAILGGGGICLVQDPASARYPGMPQSAIGAGYATHVLPVERMPVLLLELQRHAGFSRKWVPLASDKALSAFNQILLTLRGGTGHDFSFYKKSTINRRIERRMTQHGIEDIGVYARYLKEHPAEVRILFKELLINVTNFFRDPEAFVALKNDILPPLLAQKTPDDTFRVWVAGCASGEEAYSIAIVLRELMSENEQDFKVQIYATDLDDDAIATARCGSYPPNIAQDMAPERLARFFGKDEKGYKVNKALREMVVFAVHNVIKDAPFTKLDLLSCRNLLIYLEMEQQDCLITTFHYALKPDGVLFLSTSESITHQPELFTALNRKWRFYAANHAPAASARTTPNSEAPRPGTAGAPAARVERRLALSANAVNVAELTHRVLLQSWAPASVTTDLAGNILYIHGDTSRYLCAPPGPVTTNLVEMAREGLQLELRAALLDAAAKTTPTLNRDVSLRTPSGIERVRFSVRLLPRPGIGGIVRAEENLLLVSFQDIGALPGTGARNGRGPRAIKSALAARLEQLEREVAYARDTLQATVEEHQATTEELKSTNEELQSSNEELQSMNEELETSKEELQSLNEETITVNTELNARIEELNRVQNDMKNLLDNINTGTLFLDHRLIIRRYTRDAVKIYRLIAGDVGRPLGDIKSNIEGEDLHADLRAVLDTLIPREREVRTLDGAWYLVRIQPYRTLDNVIEGVVLSFTPMTDFKLASEQVKRSEAMLRTAVEIAHLGSWELDVTTGRATWSAEMFRIFGYPPVKTPMALGDVLNRLGTDDAARVAAAIQTAVDSNAGYDIEYLVTRPDGTTRRVRSRATPLADASGKVTRVVGASLEIAEK